ncbi:MAG: FtsX-like permease family protein [Actinomycetia bacterium]|nr:FtsX-like permease family protein [Actinomycetes bacterium]
MTVLRRKSWQDIRRRRARSLFTVATIAAAVVGLSMFAMPTLMDRAMADRVEQDRLHDIRFFTADIGLDSGTLDAVADLDGVRAIATRTTFPTRIHFGDRRANVTLVGVESFTDQPVNAVAIDAGTAPGTGQALTDSQNASSGRFPGGIGSTVAIEDNLGALHDATVSGVGDTLVFTQLAGSERAVLYVPQATVNEISGAVGANSIEVLVEDADRVEEITSEIRATLLEQEPAIVFAELPDVREAGTWPGQSDFNNFATLFYVGAILALISAMVLISNTMTTMVAEQTGEIAILKAIGGRRRQVMGSFTTTVGLLGLLGAGFGIVLGVPFSNLLVGYIGNEFFGVDPAWGISIPVVIVSIVIGVGGSSLAAAPALRRAARISVREGLDSRSGLAEGGALDRLIRRVPLSHNARVGLRNVTRRKARTAGTFLQIGLAVGVAIGFVSLGVTIADVTGSTWDAMSWDVLVIKRSNVELDQSAQRVVSDIDGVDVMHPTLYNSLEVDGEQLESWGLPVDSPMFEPDLDSGRWLEPADQGREVAVVGRALAATSAVGPGDTLTVGTARGSAQLEIVGVDGRLMNNGTTIYLPLSTFQDLLDRDDTNTLWVRSLSQAEPDIDRLAAAAEEELSAAGVPIRTEIHYVERDANLASNRVLVSVLAVMGVPIVAISMIGLVNLMTMNVIERTREIGILRCIGARARDVRRIFRTEAMAIAVGGWLLSIPLGWLIGKMLALVVTEIFNFGSVPFTFPLWSIPVAFAGTTVLAALVVIPPVRRAAKLRPGTALRYE